MENPENVLMDLNGFEKNPDPAIPKSLEDYLIYVAKSGNTVFPWNKIKPLIKSKLENIIKEFNESCPEGNLPKMPNVDAFKFAEMRDRIMEQLESYTGTPFTIQRLCELLVQPKRHYKRTDKFMRGLEKVMLVVSTVDPITTTSAQEASGGTVLVEREKLKIGACNQVYESPSKRIRLVSAEEEAGPCDSADGVTQVGIKALSEPELFPTAGPSNISGVSSVPSPSTATPSLPIQDSQQEQGLDSMDIDTECTSSEVKISTFNTKSEDNSVESSIENSRDQAESSPEEGVESSQTEAIREASPDREGWVMVDKPASNCDSGMVSTSERGEGPVLLSEDGVSNSSEEVPLVTDSNEVNIGGLDSTENANISDSSNDVRSQLVSDSEAATGSSDVGEEHVVCNKVETEKIDTCSSSDQGNGQCMEIGDEDTNSEAEPAEEREDVILGDGETERSVSVQSSEERNELDSVQDEPRGAADSSDEITVASAPPQGNAEEIHADQSSSSDANVGLTVTPADKTEEEGSSPDQSDTV